MNPAPRPIATHFAQAYGLGAVIGLDASGPVLPANDVKVPRLKWIHCANVGTYKGHHQGEFTFTRELFESFVRNFRNDPRYSAGAVNDDGSPLLTSAGSTAGSSAVLQFDYEHASEMPPWEGTIPQFGAPAPAWVFDVEIRENADGSPSLWALAELGDNIRGQIARKEYKFVSIAFTGEAKDWVTGEPIGPALTSIAFTNQPFMRDLQPLAARRSLPTRATSHGATTMSKTAEQLQSELDSFRTRLCKALKIRNLLDDDAIVGAVDEAMASGGSLESILETLGVANGGDAIKAVAALQDAREQLSERLAEIDAALQGAVQADATQVPMDVAAAMSASGLTRDSARVAFTAQRTSYVNEEQAKVERACKPGEKPTLAQGLLAISTARGRFLKDHGIEAGAAQNPAHSHLTRPLVARGSQQLQPPAAPQTPAHLQPGAGNPDVIDVTACGGRNRTEKVMSYLASQNAAFVSMPHAEQVRQASLFKRTHEIVDQNDQAAA